MSVTKVLLDILIVLLAAKAAAEVAERLKVPAVVGEILAGVVIGPSVLGLVQGDDVLRVLGELGVILLLLEVGLEMDIAELGAVGRASMTVATVGVVVPLVAGCGVGLAWGMTTKEAVFVGAALTATSVGITARVFGDLRALGTVEARTVLGAAVADDVMGLVILTVVVRVVSQGTVSLATVAGVVAVALAFLLVTSIAGVRLAPGLFAFVARNGRSSGTLVAAALAFTLAFSELANAAKLAPIVGAFVAGLSLSRSTSADRIRRELRPVGHLFIPVFFLQIGIDAQVREFAKPSVLGLAGALLVVAVAGKLASAAGLLGAPGDRMLIGVGMIPRGEVGLIFAALGLRERVFGEDIYGSLLLVVLATTLLTPPILRWRLLRLRSTKAARTGAAPRPPQGWLRVDADGTVTLADEPPPGEALAVALDAAVLGDSHRPGPDLMRWLAALPPEPMRWDRAARESFFRLLNTGGPRAWRFVALTGVLERALPELGAALERRQRDAFELDPVSAVRWPRLAGIHELDGRVQLEHPERLLLAAVILDATEDGETGVVVARRVVQRLDLGAGTEQSVARLVQDANLLEAASRRIESGGEEQVLQLATHLGSREQANALFLLTLANNELEPSERSRLETIHQLIDTVLGRPELTGREAGNLVEQRRAQALRLISSKAVAERIAATPRAYVLRAAPQDLARQAALCEPPLGAGDTRCSVEQLTTDTWRIDFVARDRVGLLAHETETLGSEGLDVLDAVAVTWGDGCALASFRVTGGIRPDGDRLRADLAERLRGRLSPSPAPDITLSFDDESSPWHSLCRATATDRPGLLQALTTAFATAGASVHAATVHTADGLVRDEFELTGKHGEKLSPEIKRAIAEALAGGYTPSRRRTMFKKARNATAN